MKLRHWLAAASLGLAASSMPSWADTYTIDTRGSHAFIQFRIPHLGYSWLWGRFNQFSGEFSYDASAPEKAVVQVTIDTASIDSNHGERDKHLRGGDFLDVKRYPQATFNSTRFEPNGQGGGNLHGTLTLHGVSKPIVIDVTSVGAGKDPWGGYRRGFEGKTTILLADYGINFDLGPASKEVELVLSVEGIKQK